MFWFYLTQKQTLKVSWWNDLPDRFLMEEDDWFSKNFRIFKSAKIVFELSQYCSKTISGKIVHAAGKLI